MNRSTWWELAVVAEKLGFSRRDHLASLVGRLISKGIITPDQFSRERGEIPEGPGRPRNLVFLAPPAVVAVSAHASTPEAAAFRREALGRLVSTVPALPVVSADDTPEQVRELRARLDVLEARVADTERRMLSAGVQLALPGVAGAKQDVLPRSLYDDIASLQLGKLGRGVRTKDIVDAALNGRPAAKRVLEWAEPGTAIGQALRVILGIALRRACGRVQNGRVLVAYGRDPKVWAVESVEEGAVH